MKKMKAYQSTPTRLTMTTPSRSTKTNQYTYEGIKEGLLREAFFSGLIGWDRSGAFLTEKGEKAFKKYMDDLPQDL